LLAKYSQAYPLAALTPATQQGLTNEYRPIYKRGGIVEFLISIYKWFKYCKPTETYSSKELREIEGHKYRNH